MSHLDDASILDLLAGAGDQTAREHLEACEMCRAELEAWRGRMEILRDMEAEEIGPSEEHQLRVLFRQLGPAPARGRWLARVMAQPAQGMEGAMAVRGALSSTLTHYRAGGRSVIVQIIPNAGGESYEVHGRVVADPSAIAGSAVVLHSPDGAGGATEPDPLGEFHFQSMPAGSYRLTWASAAGRLDVEGLTIGSGNGAEDA